MKPFTLLTFIVFLSLSPVARAVASLEPDSPTFDTLASLPDKAQDILSAEIVKDEPQSVSAVEPLSSSRGVENEIYVNDFNATRCAELHNQIVSLVANSPGQPANQLKKFFDAYSAEEERLRERLSLPLFDFLSQLLVPVLPDNSSSLWPWVDINFTPQLAMPHPSVLWSFEDWELGDEYVLLYPDEGHEGTGGMFFDMDTNLICMVGLPGDDMWDCPWHYLEVGLERYLELYQLGAFRLPRTCSGETDCDQFHEDISAEDLEDSSVSIRRVVPAYVETTLRIYDILLEEIASKMKGQIHDEPLVDMETLTRWGVTGFAFEFLSRARTPSFKYIAPGITVFNSDSFNDMMILTAGMPESSKQRLRNMYVSLEEAPPMLLFPGDTLIQQKDDWQGPFDLFYPYVVSNMTGVYLQADYYWGDTIELMLPYPVGANGHVRFGSAPIVEGDPYHGRQRGNGVLYQHGRCPFFHNHRTKLMTLLRLWVLNIQSGAFTVGPDGVEGGMDLYRQADTEDSAIDFNVQVCW